MEGTDSLIAYPKEYQELAEKFKKRLSIQEFKQIDAKRIHNEFSVIDGQGRFWAGVIFPKNKKLLKRDQRAQTDTQMFTHVTGFWGRQAQPNQNLVSRQLLHQRQSHEISHRQWSLCSLRTGTRPQSHRTLLVCLLSLQYPQNCHALRTRRSSSRSIPLIIQVQADRYWPALNEEVSFPSVKISIRSEAEDTTDPDHIRTKIVMRGPQG